jgi:hypothetical protein
MTEFCCDAECREWHQAVDLECPLSGRYGVESRRGPNRAESTLLTQQRHWRPVQPSRRASSHFGKPVQFHSGSPGNLA